MKTISTLSETVDLMNSSDYKDRLIAEYAQLEIRLQRLRVTYSKVDEMPVEIKTQMNVMESYSSILLRSLIAEDVEIPDIDIMYNDFLTWNEIQIGECVYHFNIRKYIIKTGKNTYFNLDDRRNCKRSKSYTNGDFKNYQKANITWG